jgi:hypothetical protein
LAAKNIISCRKAIRRSGLEIKIIAQSQPAAWIADRPFLELSAQDSKALIFVSFYQEKEKSLPGQDIVTTCEV